MESFKEGEWVILHQLNKKKLARIGRKGFTTLGKDFVSLEGAIGCLPWTNFKMEPNSGPKSGKRIFNIVPLAEDEEDDYANLNPSDHAEVGIDEEERDNRTINDDGQSQGLSAVEIEALREGGLTGKEIVNHLVANSSTYDKKTRYAKSKYLKKKESKHCLREKLSIRRTNLSAIAEVLCCGGGGEGSRGSISGMRPDTLSQMLTALNIQWRRLPSVKQVQPKKLNLKVKNGVDSSVTESKATKNNESTVSNEESVVKTECVSGDIKKEKMLDEGVEENISLAEINKKMYSGTTYIVYESGNWGLLVASLLNLLPTDGPRLIHLYPGHGVPCLIAPRALNLPQEKLSILSSVNFKALLDELGKLTGSLITPSMDDIVIKTEPVDVQLPDGSEGNCEVVDNMDSETVEEESGEAMLEENEDNKVNETCDNTGEPSKTEGENRKRKVETGEGLDENELAAKKPRWQQEAEIAAGLLTSQKVDGLVVVASREHPVSIVLSLLPYLAPSRPLVVYCPHREPLLDLYAVLKGWEPWASKYGKSGGKGGIPRVANLRVVENWLRSYQVLPNRTHPEVNMTPGGGFVLSGTVIDFSDE